VGLPNDSYESIGTYMEQAAVEVPFGEFTAYPLIPYPGTKLWNTPETFGYTIVDRDFTKYAQIDKHHRGATVLRHQNFSPDDVARWIQLTNDILSRSGKLPSIQSQVT
jgi:anaerobic magnesium-protoporphyrin IX monomethyl ester cyclase